MADSGKGKYQMVNFHFQVNFEIDNSAIDVAFQSVTGLDSTFETESIKEGGENRFEHVVPVRRKYGPLVLKRGLIKPENSGLSKWLKRAFEEGFEKGTYDEAVKPLPTVTVMLLGPDHKALMTWSLTNVWPRSWKIGELNAEQGAVLIETLELNYNTVQLN
jgi:phage tail-like protein